jgi:zinc protease
MSRSDLRAARRASIAAALLLAAGLAAPLFAAQGREAKNVGGKIPQAAGASEVIDTRPSPDGFDLPPYTRIVMPNGLVVLLMEQTEVPIVNMRLTLRGGASSDPKGKEGLASLTADLLTAGTAARTAQQLANEIDFVGGELSASAGADTTVVVSQFMQKDVEKQLELMADVVLRPAFAQAEVDRVKQQRLAEIAALPENAAAYTDAQFEAAIFAGTPYGHPAFGLRKSVESITREEVAGFYRASYAPNNGVLAVVGAFKTAEMLARLRAAFGGWERRDLAPVSFNAPAAVSGRRVIVVDYPGLTQTQIRIGGVGVSRNDPAYYALQVANVALGSGFTSRLMEEIRVNRSLSYTARSSVTGRAHPGPFLIMTFTKNATARETVDAALDVLKKFREGPLAEAELTRAKNVLLGRFPLALETPNGLTDMITAIEVFNLPRDYVETYAQRVRALASAEISAEIRKHFSYDDIYIVLFTTAAQTRDQLEGLGPIDVRNFLE